MTAQIIDLCVERAKRNATKRAMAEADAPVLTPLHAEEFTDNELVDLRKLFMEE